MLLSLSSLTTTQPSLMDKEEYTFITSGEALRSSMSIGSFQEVASVDPSSTGDKTPTNDSDSSSTSSEPYTIIDAPPTPRTPPRRPPSVLDEITPASPTPPRPVLPRETQRIRGLCRLRILHARQYPHCQPPLAHALIRWCTEIEIAEIINMGPDGSTLTYEELEWLEKDFMSRTGKTLDRASDRKIHFAGPPWWWWNWNKWWYPLCVVAYGQRDRKIKSLDFTIEEDEFTRNMRNRGYRSLDGLVRSKWVG